MKGPAAAWNSLDRKLPLLFAAAILATAVVFSAVAYHLVQRVLLRSAGERLSGVSTPIALSLQESARRQRARYAAVARDPAIASFLRSGSGRDAALRALARGAEGDALPLPPLRIELRDSTGAVVLDSSTAGAPTALAWVDRAIRSGAAAREGRPLVSPLFAEGDMVVGASVVAVPPADGADGAGAGEAAPIGYVVDTRAVVGKGVQSVRDLVGAGAAFAVGSPDEGIFTDLEYRTEPPPPKATAGRVLVFDSSARGPGVGAATAIAGTPWILWLEQPRDVVLAPMHALFRGLAIAATLIVLLGALGAWALSRQVTGPIAALADAADRVAANSGISPAGTAAHGRDEVARLNDAFARMSTRVNQSREQLEALVAERTARLEVALRELEAAQRELVKKERLAMLGQLASAVGHELRNPLGVMTNAIYVIEQSTPDAPPLAREYMELIRGQISASERIVGDLLDTARVRAPEPESLDIRELVDEQIRRLGPLPGVDLELQLPDDLPRVRMDPLQFSQIILNLTTNAVQAMSEEGGRLTITAGADGSAGRVRLIMEDTGGGMAPETLERIFEPLFTTRARGLGLGLWVSQNLAAANDAVLEATSRLGEGTTFTLDMPVAVAAASAAS